MRILTVIGARPQFIKASVVSHAIAHREGVSELMVHTGQHFDANMSDVFFADLGMAPPASAVLVRRGATEGTRLRPMVPAIRGDKWFLR